MGCLGKAVGLIILATWTGFGAWLLTEQKAHGESALPGLVVLGIGVLVAAALIVAAVRPLVPPWRHGATRGPAVATLMITAFTVAAAWLIVDSNVANRRPGRDVTAALAPACAGSPVSGAGTVLTSGVANHLVVLDMAGGEHQWTGHPSIDLRPASLADAELVVCIDPEEMRTQLEVCRYTNGPDITRFAVARKVAVHEAATGRAVLSYTASAEPRSCHQSESKELTELVGSLEWGDVEKRLAYLVAHGVDAASKITAGRPVILAPGETMVIGVLVTNTAAEPIDARLVISYPAIKGGLRTEEVTVTGLEAGERRVALAWPTDLAFESSVGVEAAVVEARATTMDEDSRTDRRAVAVTAPTLPLPPGQPSVVIRNDAATAYYAAVMVGFLREGALVAVGQAHTPSLPAGATASLALDLFGDPAGASSVVTQVDVAYPVR